MSKLTEAAVNAMRRRARAGASYAGLGREYGVSEVAAQYAVTGRTWKSATEPPVTEARQAPAGAWTPDEDAVVFDGTLAEVAERLGRTPGSVGLRRTHLRRQSGTVGPARLKRSWTPAEDAVVFDGTAREVAERLGRTYSSVANRRAALRLKARQGVTEQ